MLAAAGRGQPMQNLSPQHGLADSLDHLSSIGTKITKEFYSRQITSENLEIIWQLLHPQKHKQTYMALVLSGSVRMLFQLVDPNDLPSPWLLDLYQSQSQDPRTSRRHHNLALSCHVTVPKVTTSFWSPVPDLCRTHGSTESCVICCAMLWYDNDLTWSCTMLMLIALPNSKNARP